MIVFKYCCLCYLISCSSRKHPYPPAPPWRTVLLKYPTPLEFPYSTWLGTLWKEYLCQKCCCTLLLIAEDNFFCDKMRLILFLYVNTVPNYLKDVLISNHRGDTLLTTQIMSSTKEPITFKLNTTWNLITLSVKTCYKKNTTKLRRICYSAVKACMKFLTKTAIDETTVATLSSTKTQINKPHYNKGILLADVFTKHDELKTQNQPEWQKASVFYKQISSCCGFIHQYSPVKILTNLGRGCHL